MCTIISSARTTSSSRRGGLGVVCSTSHPSPEDIDGCQLWLPCLHQSNSAFSTLSKQTTKIGRIHFGSRVPCSSKLWVDSNCRVVRGGKQRNQLETILSRARKRCKCKTGKRKKVVYCLHCINTLSDMDLYGRLWCIYSRVEPVTPR